jgi:hypothetical protein
VWVWVMLGEGPWLSGITGAGGLPTALPGREILKVSGPSRQDPGLGRVPESLTGGGRRDSSVITTLVQQLDWLCVPD